MPDIRAVIFCDEIRYEQSGKLIIIGTYTGEMVVPNFPIQGRLQALVLTADVGNSRKFSVSLKSKGGAKFAEMATEFEMDADADPNKLGWLPLPPFFFTLSSPDDIQVWMGFDDEEERLVGELSVALPDDSGRPAAAQVL